MDNESVYSGLETPWRDAQGLVLYRFQADVRLDTFAYAVHLEQALLL
jgi:hypothetical protein